jgi:hypothetical protein
MRTIATRRAISALAVMPILLIANTTETLASTNAQKSEPMKNISDVNSELDFDLAIPTLSSMEESEDWDEPDFSESLDTSPTLNMQVTEFINSNMKAETDDRWPTIIDESIVIETSAELPTIYISAARGQSTRECRISGICE